jgi:hypothetical protein
MHQNNMRKRRIERVVREWQLMRVGNLKCCVRDAALSSQLSRALNLDGLRVHANYLTRRKDLGKANAYRAGAAAKVKQAHALLKVRQEERAFLERRPPRHFRLEGRIVLLEVRELAVRLGIRYAASLRIRHSGVLAFVTTAQTSVWSSIMHLNWRVTKKSIVMHSTYW